MSAPAKTPKGALSRIQTRVRPPGYARSVRYTGTRADLCAAKVATAEMFPEGKRTRRHAGRYALDGDMHVYSPRYFATIKHGEDCYTVTRWENWDKAETEKVAPTNQRIRDLDAQCTLMKRVAEPAIAILTAQQIWSIEDFAVQVEEICDDLVAATTDDGEIDTEEAKAYTDRIRATLNCLAGVLHSPGLAFLHTGPNGTFTSNLRSRYGV